MIYIKYKTLGQGLIIREVGTHHFWIGTHQNLVGLTILKSDESRDSPFQYLSENPASVETMNMYMAFQTLGCKFLFNKLCRCIL